MENKIFALVLTPFILSIALASLWVQPELHPSGQYFTRVCAWNNQDFIGCTSNTLTNAGLNHTRIVMTRGDIASPVVWLALGNDSAPALTDTSQPGEATGCGMQRAVGMVYNNSIGNWTIGKTFTYTCTESMVINTTGLYNASSGGTYFAGDALASSATLTAAGDTLTINYTIWMEA